MRLLQGISLRVPEFSKHAQGLRETSRRSSARRWHAYTGSRECCPESMSSTRYCCSRMFTASCIANHKSFLLCPSEDDVMSSLISDLLPPNELLPGGCPQRLGKQAPNLPH